MRDCGHKTAGGREEEGSHNAIIRINIAGPVVHVHGSVAASARARARAPRRTDHFEVVQGKHSTARSRARARARSVLATMQFRPGEHYPRQLGRASERPRARDGKLIKWSERYLRQLASQLGGISRVRVAPERSSTVLARN